MMGPASDADGWRLEAPRGTWLFCRDCLIAHRASDADRAPMFGQDGSAQPVDDLQTFLRTHEEHAIGALTRTSDRESRSHPRWDPMIRVTVEATDGESSFVIVSGRNDVGSPRRFVVRPGRLVPIEEIAELDETLLRDAVDDALFPYAAPASLLDGFVDRVRTLIDRTPLDDFMLVDEDRVDPTVELAGLPTSIVEPLRATLVHIFPKMEAARIVTLLERELRDEIPVVRVRRRYAIAD
jgi:hypothetical protein